MLPKGALMQQSGTKITPQRVTQSGTKQLVEPATPRSGRTPKQLVEPATPRSGRTPKQLVQPATPRSGRTPPVEPKTPMTPMTPAGDYKPVHLHMGPFTPEKRTPAQARTPSQGGLDGHRGGTPVSCLPQMQPLGLSVMASNQGSARSKGHSKRGNSKTPLLNGKRVF